jgi:hypothetical protein
VLRRDLDHLRGDSQRMSERFTDVRDSGRKRCRFPTAAGSGSSPVTVEMIRSRRAPTGVPTNANGSAQSGLCMPRGVLKRPVPCQLIRDI